jgi:hypothetical protein
MIQSSYPVRCGFLVSQLNGLLSVLNLKFKQIDSIARTNKLLLFLSSGFSSGSFDCLNMPFLLFAGRFVRLWLYAPFSTFEKGFDGNDKLG